MIAARAAERRRECGGVFIPLSVGAAPRRLYPRKGDEPIPESGSNS
jgi:hypothetical protein